MASTSLLPLLWINLGGEMVYVLRHRLIVQGVEKMKARQVLNEVVRGILSSERLFMKQLPPSFAETKHFFTTQANCSIMKLNKLSMQKLFELMCTGVKYQFICAKRPQEYLDITVRHLDNLGSYVDSRTKVLVTRTKEEIIDVYRYS